MPENAPAEQTQATPQIDYDAIARSVMEQMARTEAPSGDGQRGAAPQLNANAGRAQEPEARAQEPEDTRAIPLEDVPNFDPYAAEVETDPRRRAFLGLQLYRLFQAQARHDFRGQTEAQQALALRGFYGEDARQHVAQGGTVRALDTLTDADGGVFIPTVVYNEVLRLVPTYGVIRNLARVITGVSGPIKIPNLAAGLVAFWVGEGAEIKARKPTFGSVSLDPEKIGLIVPWTTEVREEVGASLLDLIVTLIAEAFGLLEDQTALYGDGTAVYGGITGLANAAGVNSYTMGAGDTTAAALTYDDLLGAMKAVPVTARRTGTWVLHDDASLTLAGIKDANGQPVFRASYESGQFDRLLGRPVVYAQAARADAATSAGTAVGFYGDFSKFIVAQGRSMTSKLMTEATIKDVDDASDIRLGAQDMEALRMTERLDMLVGLPAAFVKIMSAAA